MSARVVALCSPVTRLQELEGIVERGQKSFIDVGRALREIRDRRLYDSVFGTFESYCRARFDMTPQRAGQLIQAVAAVDNLETIVSRLPTNEGQIRPLLALSADDQRSAWQEVIARGSKVTAATVADVVRLRAKDSGGNSEAKDEPKRWVVVDLDRLQQGIELVKSGLTLDEFREFVAIATAELNSWEASGS